MYIFVPLTGLASTRGELSTMDKIKLMTEIARLLNKEYGYVVDTSVSPLNGSSFLTSEQRRLLHSDIRPFVEYLRQTNNGCTELTIGLPNATYFEVKLNGTHQWK